MLRRSAVAVAIVAAMVVAAIGWQFAIFVLPFAWTGEAVRLADLLRVKRGSIVADVGAGNGALALEMARVVGDTGVVYATELSHEQRREIASRASSARMPQIRVVEAAADVTRLHDECCEAIYLRTVFHHIRDRAPFARQIAKAVRAGGRVAIIDFPPGALWFHGDDHGVSQEEVLRAFDRTGLSPAGHVDHWGGGTYLLLFERR